MNDVTVTLPAHVWSAVLNALLTAGRMEVPAASWLPGFQAVQVAMQRAQMESRAEAHRPRAVADAAQMPADLAA
jgi:hypothetical protein